MDTCCSVAMHALEGVLGKAISAQEFLENPVAVSKHHHPTHPLASVTVCVFISVAGSTN